MASANLTILILAFVLVFSVFSLTLAAITIVLGLKDLPGGEASAETSRNYFSTIRLVFTCLLKALPSSSPENEEIDDSVS